MDLLRVSGTAAQYLVHFGEEAAPYQLGAEVLPEFQLPDGGPEFLPAVHMIIGVGGFPVELSGTCRLRRDDSRLTHRWNIN